MANQQPNQPQPPIVPAGFVFQPSDARIVHTFLIPRIRGLPLPPHEINEGNIFADIPQEVAAANGFTLEKTEIYFFTHTTALNPLLWKRSRNIPEGIISHNLLIGRKRKYYYAINRISDIKWYVEEFTAPSENSTLAVYKLYPGNQAERHLWAPAAALVINPGGPIDPLPAYFFQPAEHNVGPPQHNVAAQNVVAPQAGNLDGVDLNAPQNQIFNNEAAGHFFNPVDLNAPQNQIFNNEAAGLFFNPVDLNAPQNQFFNNEATGLFFNPVEEDHVDLNAAQIHPWNN